MELTLLGKSYKVGKLDETYWSGGARSVQFVVEETGDPFMHLSCNLPEHPLPDDKHFWAKTWSENESFREQLLNSGMFEDTGKRVQTGFVQAEMWKVLY